MLSTDEITLPTLEEVKEKGEKVWVEGQRLEIPDPGIRWKDKLEALQESKLQQQYERCLFEMRCKQAEMMGFQSFTVAELVEILMGEKHTHTKDAGDRQTYEWFYNHHTGTILCGKDCNWGGKPEDFYLLRKESAWYLPPFCKTEVWRCRFGKPDYLERQIPYGVVLRINELKDIKMFNAFNILAPIEAWKHQTDIDPIVVGSVWEIPQNKEGGHNSAGDTQHFFIAQW